MITTGINAEKITTNDTVAVDVRTVRFSKITDPQVVNPNLAALDMANCRVAISQASPTALR